LEEGETMSLPEMAPHTIVATMENPAPAVTASSAISADISAIQCWRQRELELATIRRFGEDWDGCGSDAPTSGAMDAAALFLAFWKALHFENPPARISLSPNGFLTADWLAGDALIRAEILDRDSNEIEWMRAIPGKPTEFFTSALTEQRGTEAAQVQTWQPDPDEPALACTL
jgi:hypothetical protein